MLLLPNYSVREWRGARINNEADDRKLLPKEQCRASPPSSRSSHPRDGPPHPSVDAMAPKNPLSSQGSERLIWTAGREGGCLFGITLAHVWGRSRQFLVILGARRARIRQLGSPSPRRPSAGSRCPGDRQRPAGRGGAGTWARSRRPALAAGAVRVCAAGLCAGAGGRLHIGAALAEAGLEGLALEPWICSQSLSILGTG